MSSKTIKLYFFEQHPNFGDLLNIEIPKVLFGYDVQNTDPKECDAVFIGSLLQRFVTKKRFSLQRFRWLLHSPVKIWGTGFISAPNGRQFTKRKLDIRAVRGKLSLERLRKITGKNLDDVIIGDPGLLSSYLIDASKIKKKYTLGIIPHYIDQGDPLLNKIKIKNSKILNICQSPKKFLTELAECKFIISSAMHGLIASDSLGIPNIRMVMSNKIGGGDYKFNDYYSAFGMKKHPCIDLRKIKNLDDTDVISSNYKIRPEQVKKICESLILAFPNDF